ncbi:MAG: hypothetical protein WBL25_19845, partial [Anaerolineales bacterium]
FLRQAGEVTFIGHTQSAKRHRKQLFPLTMKLLFYRGKKGENLFEKGLTQNECSCIFIAQMSE